MDQDISEINEKINKFRKDISKLRKEILDLETECLGFVLKKERYEEDLRKKLLRKG